MARVSGRQRRGSGIKDAPAATVPRPGAAGPTGVLLPTNPGHESALAQRNDWGPCPGPCGLGCTRTLSPDSPGPGAWWSFSRQPHLQPHASRLMPHASCLMPRASWRASPADRAFWTRTVILVGAAAVRMVWVAETVHQVPVRGFDCIPSVHTIIPPPQTRPHASSKRTTHT